MHGHSASLRLILNHGGREGGGKELRGGRRKRGKGGKVRRVMGRREKGGKINKSIILYHKVGILSTSAYF